MADLKIIAPEIIAAEDDQVSGALPAINPRPLSWRLHRHADYQRVYKATRKQFASLMTYFAVARTPAFTHSVGPRVGLTAGRVLGNAVERNRIKRRMRAAVRQNLPHLTLDVDVVLHPKRTVLEAEFGSLTADIQRIFLKVERQLRSGAATHPSQRTTQQIGQQSRQETGQQTRQETGQQTRQGTAQ
ncbi:MAG: ribonuclease P protein component [Acidobacteriaceae bacterium]